MEQIPEGYMKNSHGGLDPIATVKDVDKLRDQMVKEIVAKSLDASKQLMEMKQEFFKSIQAFVELSAEKYGLKVGRNGMACCPFHNDKHPSMKIDDSHYHCFGCGAHGDAIGFVAAMFGLGQYEAACRINEDFNLGICVDASMSEAEQAELSRQIRKV